jgi:hypothetical protein
MIMTMARRINPQARVWLQHGLKRLSGTTTA